MPEDAIGGLFVLVLIVGPLLWFGASLIALAFDSLIKSLFKKETNFFGLLTTRAFFDQAGGEFGIIQRGYFLLFILTLIAILFCSQQTFFKDLEVEPVLIWLLKQSIIIPIFNLVVFVLVSKHELLQKKYSDK